MFLEEVSRMRHMQGFVPAMAGVFLFSLTASAYVATLSKEGVSVRWPGTPRLNLAANTTNRSGISSSALFNMVTRGLQRWKQASGGFIQFDYWQGSDTAIYEPNNGYNGLSSLYFASNGGTQLDSNILGYTQAWYDPGSGTILEADIVINDRNFRFTTSPQDPTGIYFENVLTHELGHAFGLSHSGILQSTMLYLQADEQSHLSCDDWAGVRSVYGLGGQTGTIAGSVVASNGSPIFGAQVVAVSATRGVVMGAGMTDRSGNYAIRSLEIGNYFIYAEPYYAGASTLSEYYSGASSRVCGSSFFSRTFFTQSDGFSLNPVSVVAGGRSQLGALTVRCDSGASVTAHAGTSADSAAQLPQGTQFAVVDRVSGGSSFYYKLPQGSGTLEVHALGFSIYSAIRPRLRLLDSIGNEVSATTVNPVSQGESGFSNYDGALRAESLASGEYILEVSATPLSSGAFPAPASLDSVPFMILTGAWDDPEPPLSSVLPDNAKCAQSEVFSAYTSPGGNPPRASTSRGDDSENTGFCGTLSSSGPQGPGPGAIAGWLLPWMVMGAAAFIARLRLRFSTRVVNL